MKVLFFVQEFQFIERMGIMSLSAVLKQKNHQVELLKTQNLNFKQIIVKVKDFAPDIFAYSIMTGEHNYYFDLNQKLKRFSKALSIFGGPHPTFYPEMIYKRGIDAVCLGEGEGAFLELVENMAKKKPINRIRNLWIKEGNQIIKNPVRPLFKNLDVLPFPDREIIYNSSPEFKGYKSKFFFSGRGCPYQCTYCFNHKYNEIYKHKGDIVRFRSVDNFIREILEVKQKYPFEFAFIDDDTFLLKPRNWLKEFAVKMKRTKIRFSCNVRVDLINEKIVCLLKKAGCYAVWFGIECGNEKVRKDLLKRNTTQKQIIRTCKLFKKHSIRFATQNLIALPVDHPLKIDLETLDLNIKCRPNYAWSSILYPYPGTPLYDYTVKNGYFKKINWDKAAVTNKVVSELTFLDLNEKKQVERLHKIFGIIVEFPFLRPFVNTLISLPFDKLYQLIFFGWNGYCLRIRMESWKKSPSDFFVLLKSLLNYLKSINQP